MTRTTKIEWTERVWNPVRGCSKVSDGCKHCYAERMAMRFGGPGKPYDGLVWRPGDGRVTGWTGEARFVDETLELPLHWKKPSTVFVNSMSDLFHDDITDEEIAAVFGVMAACQQHTFQILTKRPARMAKWFEWIDNTPLLRCRVSADLLLGWIFETVPSNTPWPLPNVHLGVSVENQTAADERIPRLLGCPAAVRWISCEPLLGYVDLNSIDATRAGWRPVNGASGDISAFAQWQELPMRAKLQNGIDWVVCGGESGPKARPMHPDWARSLRDQCKAANVPFFFKQWGGANKKPSGGLLDGVSYKMRTGDKWQ